MCSTLKSGFNRVTSLVAAFPSAATAVPSVVLPASVVPTVESSSSSDMFVDGRLTGPAGRGDGFAGAPLLGFAERVLDHIMHA